MKKLPFKYTLAGLLLKDRSYKEAEIIYNYKGYERDIKLWELCELPPNDKEIKRLDIELLYNKITHDEHSKAVYSHNDKFWAKVIMVVEGDDVKQTFDVNEKFLNKLESTYGVNLTSEQLVAKWLSDATRYNDKDWINEMEHDEPHYNELTNMSSNPQVKTIKLSEYVDMDSKINEDKANKHLKARGK